MYGAEKGAKGTAQAQELGSHDALQIGFPVLGGPALEGCSLVDPHQQYLEMAGALITGRGLWPVGSFGKARLPATHPRGAPDSAARLQTRGVS